MGTSNETRGGKPWNGTFETFNDAGDLLFRERYQNGVLHGENDEPAQEYFIDGAVERRLWFRDGKPYREGGKPDFEMYHYGGESIRLQGRTIDDATSYIDTLDERGNTTKRKWQRRTWTVADPSTEHFYTNGALMSRDYVRHDHYGAPRGEGLPDTETFHLNGRVEQLEWVRPEEGQPNKIRFDESGRVESAEKGFEPSHIDPHQALLWTTQADILRQPEYPIAGLAIERDGQPWCGVFHETYPTSTTEEHYKNGKLAREDGPAHISRSPATGAIKVERWYRDGQRHREGGPADIDRSIDGQTEETWFCNDEIHREGGPSTIIRDTHSGKTTYEQWHRDGSLHRDDGPAEIKTHHDGRLEETWCKNGQEYHPTAHERMKWEAHKAQQGDPFWRPPEPVISEAHRPGGVKSAAAAAKAKATATAPKPKARTGDER